MSDNFQSIRSGLNLGQLSADPSNGKNGDIYYNNSTNNFRIFQNGAWTNLLQSGSSAFATYASDQVNTFSSNITSTTFTTFSNSPAFTFIPTVTGNYKVYCSIPGQQDTATPDTALFRIYNTSANATLLEESQGLLQGGSVQPASSIFVQSVYTLTAGTTYVFDIQGAALAGTGSAADRGDITPFYIFAEGIALTGVLPTVDISASCGNFTTTGSGVPVTNLSATINSAGVLPVQLSLQSDGSGNVSYIGCYENFASFGEVVYYFLRNGTIIGAYYQEIATTPAGSYVFTPSSSLTFTDWTPPAGTNTYTVEVSASGTTAIVAYAVLIAQEQGGGGGGGGGINQLTGDVIAGPGVESQTATVVSVGGQTAAAVADAAVAIADSTTTGLPNAVVVTDANGNVVSQNSISNSSIINLPIGDTFTASTSYAVILGINNLSQTPGQIYLAQASNAVVNKTYWCIGIAGIGATTTVGTLVPVTVQGIYTLQSGDTPFVTGDIGLPCYVQDGGDFTTTPPSSSGQAVYKIGIVLSTTQIFMDGNQLLGVN